MASPTLPELTTRAREIFRLVVEGYIASGHPVGSKALAGPGGVNLSSASIRSVLQELQDAGLLAAPHTSAGRMPTEVGLRLFVDGIMQVAEPSVAERAHIERGLSSGGTIEQALAAATSALSELSAGAGVVMVPRREPRLMQISFVSLSPVRAPSPSLLQFSAKPAASALPEWYLPRKCSVREPCPRSSQTGTWRPRPSPCRSPAESPSRSSVHRGRPPPTRRTRWRRL